MAELMKYLPEYYEEVKEFNYLTQAEEPEINDLWASLFQLKENQFIQSADSNRVRQWERLLNIRPDYTLQSKEETRNSAFLALEQRKAVVIMKLSTRAPLTYRWLVEKLTQTAGEGNFSVSIDYDSYEFHVCIANDKLNIMPELKPYLREKIPANLTLLSALETTIDDIKLYAAGVVYPTFTSSALPELSREYNLGVKLSVCGRAFSLNQTTLPEITEGRGFDINMLAVSCGFSVVQTTLPAIIN